jgi:hypothetical protein
MSNEWQDEYRRQEILRRAQQPNDFQPLRGKGSPMENDGRNSMIAIGLGVLLGRFFGRGKN